MMTCAPVLMLGFNRPEMSRRLLSCVRRARPARVYFAVDGARDGRSGEAETVMAVQALVREIDWPCDVKTRFRERNLGCARAIPDAISWFLSQEPYGIILEDDVQPCDWFFAYETELLERYRNEPRIGMVSGFNHYGFQTDSRASYHFTRFSDIWGWGTWARVWGDYSLDVSGYLPRLDEILRQWTSNRRMRGIMRSYVESVVSRPTTWDVQFALMFAAKGYLSAAPRKRLTGNLGFSDERGVHTQGYCYDAVQYQDVWQGDGEVRHPNAIVADERAEALTARRASGLLPRTLTVLGSRLPVLRGLVSAVGATTEGLCPGLFRI